MGKPAGLAKDQQRALGRLTKLPALRGFYLAGGSAVAFHLGHRRSNDLDLFSERGVDLGRVERAVKELPGAKVLSISDVTIKLELDGTLVDLVAYPYPPLEEPKAGPEGFRVASLLDLAVMKLAAVARRGIRRVSGICGSWRRAASRSQRSPGPTSVGSAYRRVTCIRCCARSRTSRTRRRTRPFQPE